LRFSPKHAWVLAGALAFLAIVLTFDPKLYINGDNVDYMNLARGVRQGHLWASDKYPPLFPLVLAPVQALFGMRLLPQKILVTLFAAGSIWLLGGIVRRRTGPRSGPWLFFAAATLIPFVEYAHYVMSEVPFLFFQLGAIAACDRWGERPAARPGRRDLVELALWIAAAFYTRTAGVALAGGVLLWLLLSWRPRHALSLAALLAVAAVPWFLHAALTTGGSPYVRQLLQVNPYYPEFGGLSLGGFVQRMGDNARVYFFGIVPETVMPALYESTYSPPEMQKLFYPLWIGIPLMAPLAAGWWRGLRNRSGVRETAGVSGAESGADPVVCVVLASLLLLCVWPAIWAGSRFLVPITPLLLLVWWGGWRLPEEIGLRGRWDRVRTVVLALLLILAVRNLVFYTQETRTYPPEWGNYFASLAWIRDHTPKDAVIIDRKPGFAEFVAGRKALGFPREADPSRMIESFRRSGATHVVLAALPYDDIERYLRPVVERRQRMFRVVYQTPTPVTYVLEFRPEAEGDPSSPSLPGGMR
jgi:4-amino-4-deoxy-L-arabinose transferase-like glycosyltransferase